MKRIIESWSLTSLHKIISPFTVEPRQSDLVKDTEMDSQNYSSKV